MSGKPHRDGVERIREWLAEIEAAETRVVQIRSRLPEAQRLEERAVELRRSVIEEMTKMDVSANGNFGWEGRVVWFLNALRIHPGAASAAPGGSAPAPHTPEGGDGRA